ncbi:uncharacterized protein LOC115444671 [Manduca sexta]|uniref:uncharacterized protein LOC115444671 n=1 Tax=Manduca sexta TaxID=7130 RepID=UPI00188F92CF|nr:uncharacterized protein LOC115444671 [Manduca sexta]
MGHLTSLILLLSIIGLFQISNGCTMEGISLWNIPIAVTILDTHKGQVLDRATSGIDRMTVDHGTLLNRGPYVEVELINSRLVIRTNDLYPEYERHETSLFMSITINFRCTNGDIRNLVVIINVDDTNNNAPVFIPNDELEFIIATPVPPGFLVTGCNDGITVQDIDLTTQRIDFAIEENDLFEIAYDSSLSTRPKEFKAVLRTKTLIRTIQEPITLRISATDVDNTNDPPITTHATIRIKSDTEFELPVEPVFSQIFYMATYSRDHQLVHEPISLQQGFDDDVKFDLDGDHVNNFELVTNSNQVSIRVRKPLPADVMLETQIFLVVKAERTYTSGASATVIVQLPEVIPLEFERAHYNGIIEDNRLQLSQLRLRQGYDGLINASISSDHSTYFTPTVEGNTITIAMSQLSENVILDNNFIYLHVVASTDRSTTSTIVTLEIIKDDHITPVFERALYSASYNSSTGLTIEPIVIVNGFDATVNIELIGDHVRFFDFNQNGSNIALVSSTLPPELYSEQQILLTVKATKPRTVGASTAIIITLPEARILGFQESSYKGTLREDVLTLETIVLSEGYDSSVSFNISGEHASYFELLNEGNRVNIRQSRPLPTNVITDNSFIVLTLGAEGLNAVTTTVPIVLEILKEDENTPLFSRNIYHATYKGTNDIDIENIMLRQGYDSSVRFRIEGEHSQYFEVTNNGNNVILSLISAIPSDVIFREKVLYINILAHKELTVGANAALLIRFPAEMTEPTQMGFSQHTYTGSIENNHLSLETVILSTGYDAGTAFFLTGDHAEHFRVTNDNNIVSVTLLNPLPATIIEDNNQLILEIEARRDRAVSVWTSVIIEIVRPIIEIPVFAEPHYRGTYVENTGLLFEDPISLSQGYDETVTFGLEGEFASLFTLVQNNNVVKITTDNSIPEEIVNNNDRLLFAMVASKPNTTSARTAILIDIQTETTPDLVLLGFERVTYIGTFENNEITIDPIVLSEGYTTNVTFTLHGDLAPHFQPTSVGQTVSIALRNPIPAASMPANGIIVLEVQASAPGAVTAHTTVVLTVVTESDLIPIVELVFSATHYTGTFTEVGGLVFTTPITLSRGYDATVQFTLEGDDSQWFGLTRSQNSAILTLTNAIPAAVIANNRNLIFSVVAQRPGSADARSTIVIALADEYNDGMSLLGFERVTYVGTFINNAVTVDPIELSEGYTPSVTFTLHGDLASHFQPTSVGQTVSIALRNPIPAASMPANGIIVLEVQASAPVPSRRTPRSCLLLSRKVTSFRLLSSFSAQPITLAPLPKWEVSCLPHRYDSQWFGLTRSQNSAILTLTNAIPAAVIANNRNLIFSVVAQRPGSADARSTIVIALADEYNDGMSLLGFERVTYVGTFINNAVTVDPIVLSEGYTPSVTFTLHGGFGSGAVTAHTTVVLTVVTESDLIPIVELVFSATHYTGTFTEVGGLVFTTPITLSRGYDATVQFTLEGDDSQWFGLTRSQNSAILTVTNAIPAAVIANNRNLIFSVVAQRPGSADARSTIVIALADGFGSGAVTAHTTVVLTVVTESDLIPIVELVFSATHYTGTFTEVGGLVFTTPITLSRGYDATVQFTLEGDDSQWFGLTRSQNSAILTLTNAIPAAVIANNRNLIFSVVAQRPGSADARSTIVIALADEYNDGMSLLGFERVTYVGTFINNAVTVDPIVLSEGYTPSVTFTLHGVGQTVSIALRNPIPAASMPANGIIVLEVQASAPGAVTAHTTVVLTVVTESDLIPIVELVFSATHYTGTFTEVGGLVFTTPITLSRGYDATVQFTLEGDDSQWFGLTRSQNSAILTLTNAIPAAVIANNRNLIFSVVAQRPGSADARSTIVIALADEYNDGMSLLGFERVTYVGTFINNAVTVDPIVLSEGYTPSISPHTSSQPQWVKPSRSAGFGSGAVTAHTTVVLTVVTESDLIPIVELVFSATHYTGTFTEVGGLVFTTPITLSRGYDATVQFTLEGDDSQWFGLTRSQNSAILTLTNAIPAAVIANNRNLIFSVVAQRPGSADARSTIVIALADEYNDGMSLLGFERVTYVGTFINNAVTVDPIVLSEGYTPSVTFTLHGDLASHFQPTSVGQTVSIALRNPIPAASMPANGIIVLEVQASAPGAVTAHTTVVLTVVTESDLIPIVELVFSATHYTGTFTEVGGLVFTTPITLSRGYDATVQFTLEGDDSQWFGLTRSQNSAILTLTNAIPAAVIANNRNLIFSVVAQRPGSADARSTIIIALADEYNDGMSLLGFERVTYVGTFINNAVTIDPIVLSEGYTPSVTFTLHGDLASYFKPTSVGQTVSIALRNPIPAASMPANGIIVLEVQASAPGAVTAHTTVVLTVVTESDLIPIVELVFSATHYTGTFTEVGGLVFTTPITLSRGYDATVQFTLEGDDSQWFGLTRSQNSAILTLTNAIPAAVIANNRNLIFSVVAQRPGSADARSTIVIALADEYNDGMSLLGFERVTYVGTFINNAVTVDPIVLSEGYTPSVTFTLHGDLASHFQPTSVGQTVSIALRNPIPAASMPANGIIVLEVQASAPVPSRRTPRSCLLLSRKVTSFRLLSSFSAQPITLAPLPKWEVSCLPHRSHYLEDTTPQCSSLYDSQWFGLTRSQNSAILTVTNAIPAAVIANNRNLIFSVVAQRPGSADARSTIVIALADEYNDGMSLLGFERVTYVGTFINNAVTVDPIVLSEGYTPSVTFTLHGDLASYFQPTSVGQTVSIALRNPIPAASMPANGIIVLEVQASAPGAVTAHTTVVLTVVTESDLIPIVELVFSATHYTGTFTEVGGLVFTTPITLSRGYDATVQFTLEGDDSQWFGLTRSQNSAILTLTNAIPAAVIANNRNLIFSVVAQRPGSADARSTIVIALADEYNDGMSLLGFERVTYVGTFINNAVTVDPIVLSEGYTPSVTFTLHGDLASHFQPTSVGQTVSIALRNPIPAASMPANGIIVLEVQASAPGAVTAHTTVVLTVVTESDLIPIVELVFSATHYTGTFTEVGGLVFTTPITLSRGYDATVQFTLEGDDSQWFGLTRSQNSAILTVTNAIPAAVIANNRNLIFSVVAQRPGSADARSTIVIALADEYNDGMSLLGFERVTYVGTFINNAVTVDPIVLSEGYTPSVTFTLHGDLASYFQPTSVGQTVSIALRNPIPAASMPANGIIVLEVQASAPGAVTAHTTVVLTVVTESDLIPIVELVFSATHYTGTFTEVGGLVFTTPITLSRGYDATVQFTLEGDDSQWFGLTRSQNSAILTLTNAIPAAVIANNRNLIFSVVARRPGSADARSTIVIALSDEYNDGMSLLGFERVTYIGTFINNAVTVDPIVLSEGYTPSVTFTLHGDLASHFQPTSVGQTVSIALLNPIPAASMPANGIIVLEVQASAPGAVTAHTTVVLTVITESDLIPIVELVFSATHYTGTFTEVGGLVFTTPITLSRGYDATVQFTLEGNDSQWFGLTRSQNSAILTLTNAIPAAVIANNRNLIFSIVARRPGSADARSTIVIALADEYNDGMSLLGFERVTYVGTFINNAVTVDPIVLSEGYTPSVTFMLHGDLASHFQPTSVGQTVSIALRNPIPAASMPANGIIVLEVQASAPGAVTAHTTVVLTVVAESDLIPIVELVFSATHYTGTFTEVGGLVFTTPITLSQGYDATVQFTLEGDDSQWFGLTRSQNSAILTLTNEIPGAVMANNRHLIFFVVAQRPGSSNARATIVISLNNDANIELDVRFDRVLYDGIIRNNVVVHEKILLEGYTDQNIEINGEFSGLFVARVSNGELFVQKWNWATIPNVNHIALELQVSTARAILLLVVDHSGEEPSIPVVTFNSPSYSLSVDNTQTGFIGRVVATADNGETIRYSISSNDHLADRLSINDNGEVHLSAPAPSGVYSAVVIATTVFTQARSEATLHITVTTVTTCGDDNLVLPPLIILNRDEEVAHQNLVVLNETEHPGCRFVLTNRWPANQSWLYIDEAGLHTKAIDREHESIAFMTLSQVQVELTLLCNDETARMKRSLDTRPEWLSRYDYGTNEWILTDNISYNPRRSLVNLIVNDINDNRPIFIGKENEPIAVGYPIDDLVETVMPRSLAELQATDADVGINAALVYWSTEELISVAPTTGFVHVRDGVNLENNTRLVIHATDRRGTGLSGSIELLVKLINTENIVILTVRDAFLDDEFNILAELSTALGYEVKALRSTVMPAGGQANRDGSSRKQRNTQATGSSLQLYIYGMMEREPVSVERLTADVNNNAIVAVNVASVVSLEDYLEGQEICVIPGRDTGLLVATILLSILLFILIVLIAVWFILKRRKERNNYDEFSDQNSLASRNESLGSQPKIIIAPKPRLNIDEIKKSERRLQDMLQATAPEPEVRPTTSRNEYPPESKVDMSLIDSPAPVVTVIQSIDKLKDATDESDTDEFGEVPTARRKSVVTFNENVEKIIHVEDNDNLSAEPDYEIYKL